MESIRLQDAYLCPDCQTVIANAMRCVCGNQHGLLSLSAALNRSPVGPSEIYGRLASAVDTLETALTEG
jgi:hypothetical protein